jgi:hypothetical protein
VGRGRRAAGASQRRAPQRRLVRDHRLDLLHRRPDPDECGCDGIVQRRLQIPADFDVVRPGYDGFWEDESPTEMVSVRLDPCVRDPHGRKSSGAGGVAEIAPSSGPAIRW